MKFFVFHITFLNSNFQQQCNELNKITQVNKSQLPFVIFRLDYEDGVSSRRQTD